MARTKVAEKKEKKMNVDDSIKHPLRGSLIMTIVTPEQALRRTVTEGLQLHVFQWPYKSDDSSIISLRMQIFFII